MIENTIQNQSPILERRTDSSEMAPENLDQTRNQLVAVTDLSEWGDIEKILCISPNGYAVEITPDQLLAYVCQVCEEVPLATILDQLTISDRRTDSSEMAPENLDQTRQQSVAVTDLSELEDIEKILCISTNGYAVEITPDQLLEYVCP